MPESKPKITLKELQDIYDIEDGENQSNPEPIVGKKETKSGDWIINEYVDEAEDKLVEEETAQW